MESIIQQRDMYRILLQVTRNCDDFYLVLTRLTYFLQEAGWGDSQSPTKFGNVVTSTPAPSRHEGARSVGIEAQLNETKTRLEEQESNCQKLKKERKDIEKALNERIQTLQDQLVDLRAQNVRLGTQTQYADEKEKLLQVINKYIFTVHWVHDLF